VPLFLWNDTSPAPGAKYRAAYFARFPNVWAQGDFAAIHPTTRHVYILGRSDGVLNPSGVRFGSADIYAVLERWFAGEVVESLCVGQRRPSDADERVVLFLLMREGSRLREKGLEQRIRERIATDLTKRHVPQYIFEVPDIPVSFSLSYPTTLPFRLFSHLLSYCFTSKNKTTDDDDRPRSMAKRSSCPSSTSFPDRPSSPAERC
jgi:acetoacetyl-CoA synthetase